MLNIEANDLILFCWDSEFKSDLSSWYFVMQTFELLLDGVMV